MNNRARLLTIVFVVAVGVRLAILAFFLPKLKPDVDMDSYRSLARHLAAASFSGKPPRPLRCARPHGAAPLVEYP